MFIAERSSLIPVKVLVSNPLVHLELFENKNGNLFLSSVTDKPGGTVYYATTPSLFCAFLENSIPLQTLYNQSPSVFVEITSIEKTALYSFNDVQVKITCGDKTIKELAANNPIEIWACGSGNPTP